MIDNTWAWRQLAPATPPPHRVVPDMVWDPVVHRVVLYGGQHYTGSGTPTGLDDTWALVGDEWVQLSPATVPPARSGHAMVYDTANSRVLMMGGTTPTLSAVFDETWEYKSGNWHQLTVATIQDAHNQVYNHLMVWDAGGSRALALMWADATDNGNQTWKFSSGNWSKLTLTPEFAASGVTVGTREYMAGCWADDRMLVAGGGTGNSHYTNDVVALSGTAWSMPVAYVNSAFGGAYTPWRFQGRGVWTGDQFFFYGGQYNTSSSTGPDTIIAAPYLYDKTTHALTAFPGVDPGIRSGFAMVWTGARIVLFGGQNTFGGTPTLGDTWVLEPPVETSANLHHTFGL